MRRARGCCGQGQGRGCGGALHRVGGELLRGGVGDAGEHSEPGTGEHVTSGRVLLSIEVTHHGVHDVRRDVEQRMDRLLQEIFSNCHGGREGGLTISFSGSPMTSLDSSNDHAIVLA